MTQIRIFRLQTYAAAAALVFLSTGCTGVGATQSITTTPFPTASIKFEQNATDEDLEVVFEVKADQDGLATLKVVSPDGRTVVDLTAPDASTLGLRQFRIESPEPKDGEALKAAYPEGPYEFTGKTFAGVTLVGTAILSHRLPAPATLVTPAPEAEDVPIKDAEISWDAVAGVASYIVEIEQDELKTKITAVLTGATTSFSVPNGFLLPGREYELALGTVAEDGNASFFETSFNTMK